jgi:hypothetical protein
MSPAATIVTTLDGVADSAADGEGIGEAAVDEVTPGTTLVWEEPGSAVGVAFEQANTETARMTRAPSGAPERLAFR